MAQLSGSASAVHDTEAAGSCCEKVGQSQWRCFRWRGILTPLGLQPAQTPSNSTATQYIFSRLMAI
ncbi:MAG: hypothetical protein K6E93_00090 [Bacteroidales bacterium]|nr:hypothetical protein [Bacteroidales bacterium]